MKAEIIREEVKPVTPPIKSIKLELSLREAQVLLAVTDWHSSVATTVVGKDAGFHNVARIGFPEINDTLYALFGQLTDKVR